MEPADAILSVTEQVGDVLVCMGTRGHGRVGWALRGSVAEEVVSRSRFPVLLAGPKCRAPADRYKQVFVALDGSACAETALPLAQRLGGVLGATLTLVSVAAEHRHHPQARRRVTTAYLREVADRLNSSAPVETTALTGDPATALVEALPSDGALLVMSTHGRSGLERVTLGSVASSVCRHAELPVVVTRPAALQQEHGAVGC